MREKLIQYVELLFAGISDCAEMKQEILQYISQEARELL